MPVSSEASNVYLHRHRRYIQSVILLENMVMPVYYCIDRRRQEESGHYAGPPQSVNPLKIDADRPLIQRISSTSRYTRNEKIQL